MNSGDLKNVEFIWGGKLPSHGDFIWSSKKDVIRYLLENWMHLGMIHGRSKYGDNWKNNMKCSPLWNMMLSCDLVGENKIIAGCLSPSFDKVGRCYPFIVAYVFHESAFLNCNNTFNEIPLLLNKTADVISNSIQRALHQTIVDQIIEHILGYWISNCYIDNNSFDVKNHSNCTPSFPWSKVYEELFRNGNTSSYWWPHNYNDSRLKAFHYQYGLDENLMAWLFTSNSSNL